MLFAGSTNSIHRIKISTTGNGCDTFGRMANTSISLQLSEGVIVPSQGSVSVVQGDTVTFANPGTSPVVLFFSPATAAALSPSPAAATTISAGGQQKLEFTTSAPGAYSVFFGVTGASGPADFPSDQSSVLNLEVSASGVSFGGVIPKTSTGG